MRKKTQKLRDMYSIMDGLVSSEGMPPMTSGAGFAVWKSDSIAASFAGCSTAVCFASRSPWSGWTMAAIAPMTSAI